MKIKIKDIFEVLIKGFPVSTNSLEIAEIVILLNPEFPYTKRTLQEYLNRFRSGNTPTISKIRGEMEVEIDIAAYVDAGFSDQYAVELIQANKDEEEELTEDEEEITEEEVEESKPVNVVDFVVTGGEAWSIEGKDYIWNASGNTLSIDKNLLNDIFYYYSKHGMNWTRSKICRKFDIAPKVFRSILRAFELSKDSNIYAPHVPEDLTEKELDDYITHRMKKVFTSGERVEEKYTDAVNKAYMKVVDDNLLQQMEIDEFLGEIAENIQLLPQQVPFSIDVNSKNDEIVIVISDTHIGAEVDNLQRTQDYNTDKVIEYFSKTAEYINRFKSKRVVIVLTGDLLEGGPTNHANSFKGIERGKYWGYQLILASQILTDFFGKVSNIGAVYITGGNHDRATGDNKSDTESTYAAAIAYFLQQIYKDKIDIQYHHDTLPFDALDCRFIVQHGHKGYHKKAISDIILNEGDVNKYNILLQGHLHSLQIHGNWDNSKYMKMICPSFFTGNEFSSSGGWSSLPGFVVFRRGFMNKEVVDFQIIRL